MTIVEVGRSTMPNNNRLNSQTTLVVSLSDLGSPMDRCFCDPGKSLWWMPPESSAQPPGEMEEVIFPHATERAQ